MKYSSSKSMKSSGGCGATKPITPNEKMVTSKASTKNRKKGSEGKHDGISTL